MIATGTEQFPAIERVSVVIAAWNGSQYLRETLDSIAAQTRPADEVIVVDDGSTDDTAQIAKGYGGITVICQANAGRSAARNRGLAEARGEGVIFLDQDDLLLPDCIRINLDLLNAAPTASFVAGYSQAIDQEGRPTGKLLGTPAPCSYASMLAGKMFVPPSVALFRSAVIHQIGGFDPALTIGGEDSDLYLRAAQHHDVVAHSTPVVAYRRHPGNGSGDAWAMVISSVQFMEKQRDFVAGDPVLEQAFATGYAHWCDLFGRRLVPQAIRAVRAGRFGAARRGAAAALRYYPRGFVNFPQYLRPFRRGKAARGREAAE